MAVADILANGFHMYFMRHVCKCFKSVVSLAKEYICDSQIYIKDCFVVELYPRSGAYI